MVSRQLRESRLNLRRTARWVFVGVLSGCLVAHVTQRPVRAEEPYQRFLEKLRDEKLYDMALQYLVDLQSSKAVSADFSSSITLERALLLQQAAQQLPPKNTQRAQKQDQAEAEFQSFLNANKDHPRRSEARLGLGNLLLLRAEESKATAKLNEPAPEAAKYFASAKQLFEDTAKELAERLSSMQGNRTDAEDNAKVELRDRYRNEYRQSQLLSAYSSENEARCQGTGSAAWKSGLEKAQELYSKLYLAEKDRLELRNYALFYRSGIQRDLGKIDDAVDGLQRITDIEGVDPLRPLQVQALTELVKLLCRDDQAKYPVAIEKGEAWLKKVRPDERNSQEVVDLKAEVANAKIGYAASMESKKGDERVISRLRKEARVELQQLVRVNGPHQDGVREKLATLGVEKDVAIQVEIPKVKTFKEAMEAAQERIEQAQTNNLAVEVKKDELQGLSADALASKKDELAKLEETVLLGRSQAAELLRQALILYRPSEGADKLLDARYRLASMYLQLDRPWDAIAVGDFLARTNAGSPIGIQCATVALAGYGKLISAASDNERGDIAMQLEPLAEFMVSTWPDASETQAAAGALVQLAMMAGNFDKAEAYLDKLPAGTPSAEKLRRETGLQLAGKFLKERAALPAGTVPDESLNKVRDRAASVLSTGLENLKADQLDVVAIEANNALIRMLLAAGKAEEAQKWATRPGVSSLFALRANPDLVDNRNVKLATYSVALQAAAAQLGSGGNTATMLPEIVKITEEMRAAAGTDDDGKKLLAGLFVGVARDLQELVKSAKTPAMKQKLAEGLSVIAKEVAKNSSDFNTQLWSAQTLSNMAELTETGAGNTSAMNKALLKDSADILESILAREAKEPGWIKPDSNKVLVSKQLGTVYRLRGDFGQAVNQFATVLRANASMVDVQQEAARTLQAWAEAGTPEKFQKAIRGEFPDGKNRANVIWGWGKLSQVLSGKPQFESVFFEARYELGACLYKESLQQNDPAKKKRLLEQALKELNSTQVLYPSLGGEESTKKYEALIKQIRKDLG